MPGRSTAEPPAPLAVVEGRGHPMVRARHGRTLELTADADIGPRATCVVAVAAQVREGSLEGLAGPLTLTLTVEGADGDGPASATMTALANPAYRSDGSVVVRRSANRLADTLATTCDLTAAELPEAVVTRLRHPGAVVRLSVARAPAATRPVTVLVRLGPDPAGARARVDAEVAAGSAVSAEDVMARQWAAAASVPLVDDAERSGHPRSVILAGTGLPGTGLHPPVAPDGVASVEGVGLVPADLAAAAVGGTGPWLDLTVAGADRRELARWLVAAPSWARLVVAGTPEELAAPLAAAAGDGRTALALVVDRDGCRDQAAVAPVGAAAALVEAVDRGGSPPRLVCALTPVAGHGTTAAVLEPSLRRLVANLVDAGVPTGTLARALAPAAAMGRNAAWRSVQALRSAADPADPADDRPDAGPGAPTG
jgi:hypothetical protein